MGILKISFEVNLGVAVKKIGEKAKEEAGK